MWIFFFLELSTSSVLSFFPLPFFIVNNCLMCLCYGLKKEYLALNSLLSMMSHYLPFIASRWLRETFHIMMVCNRHRKRMLGKETTWLCLSHCSKQKEYANEILHETQSMGENAWGSRDSTEDFKWQSHIHTTSTSVNDPKT